MTSVCFYFQVHQPLRLRPYSFFDVATANNYFDEEQNRYILEKVSEKCYLPTNKLLLRLIRAHKGKFKLAFSISGILLDQLCLYRPDVLDSFIELGNTGCVEFLSETYAHSLAFVFSKDEFVRQVKKQNECVNRYFNQLPTVFRNTELIYRNDLADTIHTMGFKGALCEGVDRILMGRSSNFLYQDENRKIKLLLKNYRLSDDVSFRFSDKNWKEFPLTADKFASWIHSSAEKCDILNLFMDYETFGEHQWDSTGIFKFLQALPDQVLKNHKFRFSTPSEIISNYTPQDIYSVPDYTSWADTERDLSAWTGNSIQAEALRRVYSLEKMVHEVADSDVLSLFENLQTSDHFYYMSTKFWQDGDVHKYFSPYNSPYDAYVYFSNVLSDFEQRLANRQKLQLFQNSY